MRHFKNFSHSVSFLHIRHFCTQAYENYFKESSSSLYKKLMHIRLNKRETFHVSFNFSFFSFNDNMKIKSEKRLLMTDEIMQKKCGIKIEFSE